MSYNLRYTGSFDVQQSAEPFLSIKVDIFKKDYVGAEQTITLTGTPVIHEWQDDDPFAPIKGSTCKIGIINDGTINLDDFYSNEDTTFGVEVKRVETGEVLFAGYILQDDCREIQVDFAHEIFITVADGLGLIKDVTLGEAALKYGAPNTYTSIYLFTIPGNFSTICSPDSIFAELHAGDTFEVTSGYLQGIWTVTGVTLTPAFDYYVNVAEYVPSTGVFYSSDVIYNTPIDLTGYVNLLTILRLCFKATQVEIGFSAVGTIVPTNQDTGRWLEDTYILPASFKNDGTWISCYEVLEQIATRFKASAFQAYGRWWLVRWGEMYFQWSAIGSQTMDGVNYNTDFALPTSVTYDDYAFSLLQGDIEAGLEKAIQRPISHAREQFDYRFPTSLLLNADLQQLGPITNQYVSGSNTIYEYILPHWIPFSDNPTPTVTEQRIRIIKDTASGDEVDRYCYIKGQAFSDVTALQSNNIEVGAGDVITWSFDFCVENNEPGPVNSVFSVWGNDGTSTYKLNNNGQWFTVGGDFTFSTPSGDNVQNWHTVTITSQPLPVNANLRLFLSSNSSNDVAYESRYRNFNFSIQKPDDSLKYAIGHIHRDNNAITIKNNTDINIMIDDSPRSSIAGTLFEFGSTGPLRNKTTIWTYSIFGESGKLGYLTTLEQMVMMYKPRSLYYGNILKIWHGTEDDIRFISNFFIFNLLNSSDARRFVPGSLSIDYKHNSADITLHEINAGDLPEDAEDYYTFNYIYDNG
jgi:hypothetical protein